MSKFVFTAFLLLILFVGCAMQAESEIHLIPKGYLGKVVIYFEQKNGASAKYEDGFRLYEIPQNGILRTEFGPNYGVNDPEDFQYYYVDEKGKREELEAATAKDKESHGVVVFGKRVISGKDGEMIEYIVDEIANAKKYESLAIDEKRETH